MIDVKYLPKVELHVHLDGSVRPSTASELLGYETKYDMVVDPKTCDSLNDYLSKFDIPNKVMQTKENLSRVAYELGNDLRNDNVIYAEIRFAPSKHIKEGLNRYEVVESVLNGLSRVDLKTNLILCLMRGDSFEDNLEVINVAKHFLGKGVCAIDLAGAESMYPTKDYEELFAIARKYNIPFTIHAGEADNSSSIKAALSFGAKRIGHGIRCLEDSSLVKELIEKDILLEICPTSNIQTEVVKNYQSHPIKELYEKNIKVCVNTDNRTVSNTTLNREYKHLISNLGFTIDDFIKMNKEAIKHSFISEQEKEKLINKLSI